MDKLFTLVVLVLILGVGYAIQDRYYQHKEIMSGVRHPDKRRGN